MSTLTQFTGGGIKSVQRGFITVNASTVTATINAVNLNKSTLVHLGQSGYYTTSSFEGVSDVRIALTSSTQITASTAATPNAVTYVVSYEVIEYN